MKKISVLLIALVASMSALGPSKGEVDIAISSPDHTTLVAAVKTTHVVTTLKSANTFKFTVFAPTKSAFATSFPKERSRTCLSLKIRPNWQKSSPIMWSAEVLMQLQ